jgi:hypothetical protein
MGKVAGVPVRLCMVFRLVALNAENTASSRAVPKSENMVASGVTPHANVSLSGPLTRKIRAAKGVML